MSRTRKIAEEQQSIAVTWSTGQAYTMALVCLALGLTIGYLLRGSSATTSTQAAAPVAQGMTADQIPGMGGMPTGQSPNAMVDRVVAPLLEQVKNNPKDVDALTKIGNTYYDAKLYEKATQYYAQVLEITPKNVNVRTDMGTAYWYLGDADRAITEFERSLRDSPNHGQTMFNLGIVKWQGKKDPKGAIAIWTKLLETNPNYPERQNVEQLIQHAKEEGLKN